MDFKDILYSLGSYTVPGFDALTRQNKLMQNPANRMDIGPLSIPNLSNPDVLKQTGLNIADAATEYGMVRTLPLLKYFGASAVKDYALDKLMPKSPYKPLNTNVSNPYQSYQTYNKQGNVAQYQPYVIDEKNPYASYTKLNAAGQPTKSTKAVDTQKAIDLKKWIDAYTKLSDSEMAQLNLQGAQARKGLAGAKSTFEKSIGETSQQSAEALAKEKRSLVGEMMDRAGLLADVGGVTGPAQEYGMYTQPSIQSAGNVADILKAAQQARLGALEDYTQSKIAAGNAQARINLAKKQAEAEKIMNILGLITGGK
jgi:hypothetical protein